MRDAPDVPVPRIASAPFDDPDADVILRTADHVDFRTHRTILKLASPVFKDMFSLPQPRSAVEDMGQGQIPVVPVSELSVTLDPVLRFCYPVEAPYLENTDVSISLIVDILAAARKYDISIVIAQARKALRAHSEADEKNAFAVYSIACRFKWEEEAHSAAVSCLKWSIPGPEIPELSLISGLDHYNLVRFHKQACGAVTALLQNRSFCTNLRQRQHYCVDCYRWHAECDSQWWTSFLSDLRDVARLAPLSTSKLTLRNFRTSMETSKCVLASTHRKKAKDWKRLKESILASVREEINKIELNFSWK